MMSADRLMYEYQSGLCRLERMRGELELLREGTSVRVQGYEEAAGGAGRSDPVADRAERIDRLEGDIRELERRVMPLVRMLEDLDAAAAAIPDGECASMLTFFSLRYLAAGTMRQVAGKMHISTTSAYRIRKRLGNMAAEYLGLRTDSG